MKHFAFKQSTKAMLKFSFKQNSEEIFSLGDLLGEGPLENMLTEEGWHERIDWLEKSIRLDSDAIHSMKKDYAEAITALRQLNQQEDVAVWLSNNAGEQLGLRLICLILKGQKSKIRVYNASTHQDVLFPNQTIRNSGEMNAEQAELMREKQMYEILTDDERTQYEKEAIIHLESNSLIRTWDNNKIIDDVVTRDDRKIIQHGRALQAELPANEYYIAARLVGEVLGWSEHDISDSWIEYRLLTLIEQGVFEFEGNLKEMRLYKIRLKNQS